MRDVVRHVHAVQSTVQREIRVAVMKIGFGPFRAHQKAACDVIAHPLRVNCGPKKRHKRIEESKVKNNVLYGFIKMDRDCNLSRFAGAHQMRLTMSPSIGRNLAAIFCALVAAAVYWNTLECGICYDDEPAIKKNKDLRPNLTSWFDLLYHDFWGSDISSPTSHKSYRPLTVATFRLNYMLHELQPLGYHLVNVLLHSAVCYLYVLLCGVVFSEVWPALIAGLLFAVHPIHTEAVS